MRKQQIAAAVFTGPEALLALCWKLSTGVGLISASRQRQEARLNLWVPATTINCQIVVVVVVVAVLVLVLVSLLGWRCEQEACALKSLNNSYVGCEPAPNWPGMQHIVQVENL